MKGTNFHFRGRGIGTGFLDEPYRYIRCGDGTVMVISCRCHKAEFVLGFCRRVTIDRWGVYIHDPFRRCSDPGLARSWAEPMSEGLFLFQPIRLEIVSEEDWMREEQ